MNLTIIRIAKNFHIFLGRKIAYIIYTISHMSNKVTINQTTGNIVCVNEVVQGQLAVGSLVGKNGGPVNVSSDIIVSGKTQFNQNVQALGGISSGSVPIWIGQDEMDIAGGTLVLDSAGLYQLKESVQGSFTVTGDNISLGMCNQTITPGVNSPLYGIQVFANNFKGWDGTIKGFESGVWVSGTNGVSLQNVTILNSVVPLVQSLVPAAVIPEAVVPAKFAEGPVKHQPRALPNLNKPASKPQYTPSDASKAAKEARVKHPFVNVRVSDGNSAPQSTPKAEDKKAPRAKQAKWSDIAKSGNLQLKPSMVNARLAAHVSARAAEQRAWVGPHNGVPFAGIYIENCYNVSLNGILCDGSAEVGIVLADVYGFSLQNIIVSNGNRGLSIVYSNAGYVNNVKLTGNTDTSEYENSAALEFTNCRDVQSYNIQVSSNYKGVYSETFDTNSGIVAVIGCENVYFTDCSFTDNRSSFFAESYPTMSALLVLENKNCVFKNCHFDYNFRENTEMPGGYLYACACMYNSVLTFDGCTASVNSIYDAQDSETASWLVVANNSVTFKNCEASSNYADGTTFDSNVDAFIFVYVMGLTVENCKSTGLTNNSNDGTGIIQYLVITEGSDGAVVKGFQCDSSNSGCNGDNYGIYVSNSNAVRLESCSCNELYSNNATAYGIRLSGTSDCVVDKCVSTKHQGDNFGVGFYLQDCYTCTVTNSVGSNCYGPGFYTDGSTQQCVFRNNAGNNNYWTGFYDDSSYANAWFGNTAAGNDQNYALYGNGNTYIFWSNNVGGYPWSSPNEGYPSIPSAWDNIDIRYD